MALIDKGKLYVDMLNEMSGTGYQSQVLSVIGRQPEINVTPVRYAHIITYGDRWLHNEYCSECKKRLCSRFRNYCPNCGAKIILEDNKNGT